MCTAVAIAALSIDDARLYHNQPSFPSLPSVPFANKCINYVVVVVVVVVD
jgi:hypothetical protein